MLENNISFHKVGKTRKNRAESLESSLLGPD